VLAGALFPTTTKLAHKLWGKRKVAAGLLTLVVLLAFVVPLGGVTAWVVKLIGDGVTYLREILESQGIHGVLDRLPGPLESIAERVLATMPDEGASLEELPTAQGGKAAAAVGGVLAGTAHAVLQAALFLVAFYFLLLDGGRLVRFLDSALPFRRMHLRELLGDFRRASIAVMVSTIATAGIQTIVAAVGLFVARAPQVLFFTLATFFLALIPAVGAASVPIAVGVLLLFTGHWLGGTFLIGWGVLVVGLVDNVVKPYLIKEGIELHGAVVFFALLGGLALFGATGLVAGPLIVVFFMSTIRIAEREREDERAPHLVVPDST
jgi:predicted PurR-regulated permease PerM